MFSDPIANRLLIRRPKLVLGLSCGNLLYGMQVYMAVKTE